MVLVLGHKEKKGKPKENEVYKKEVIQDHSECILMTQLKCPAKFGGILLQFEETCEQFYLFQEFQSDSFSYRASLVQLFFFF